MSTLSGAVFLSYASQDAEAAKRICEALRAAGVEVWFDQDALVGGDAWDAKIRGQIGSCALFIPVVSANTQAREEGYFRLEWKLAEDRSHLMAKGKAFIVPVTVDGTTERGAEVPDAFLRVQWTKLPGGETSAAFVTRVQKLLGGSNTPAVTSLGALQSAAVTPPRKSGLPLWGSVALGVAVVALAAFVVMYSNGKDTAPVIKPVAGSKTAVVLAPVVNDKSIAVLPFANLSTDKENEFFADGIHDEVITALAKIHDLKPISRTSVLAFRQTEGRNLRKIATELGVANVLEGSVQRAGNKVKVIVQLIDARTDQHLWAETYIEDLTDVFTIQAKLTGAIAAALKATLSSEEKSLIERRPTQNPAAYALYLMARTQEEGLTMRSGLAQFERVAAAYQRVVVEDPSFGSAYALLTLTHARIYWFGYLDPSPQRRAMAGFALNAAVRIAPDAPETFYARGSFDYFCDNNWARALTNYRQAEVALPNDAALQGIIGYAHRRLGNWQETVLHLERAVALGPRNLFDGAELANFLICLRRFDAARQVARRFAEPFPDDNYIQEVLARSDFAVHGDRVAYLKALAVVPVGGRDPTGLGAEYERALWAHDFAAAERTLADPRLKGITDHGGIINEPTALHRALVACLLGKNNDAQRFADEAKEAFDRQSWAPRQLPYVMLGVARAKGFAGRHDEAWREAQAAVTLALGLDAYGGNVALGEAGRTYAWIGRREESLAVLRTLMTGISRYTPNEIRIDPLWSRLKDDPRFEEILKSAKPL